MEKRENQSASVLKNPRTAFIGPIKTIPRDRKPDRPSSRQRNRVFGEQGYHRAGISEITRKAGVAQGTFYVHFQSKQDLMANLVKYLSHEIRRVLKQATSPYRDRRDVEREGMQAFFPFLKNHRWIYRVIPECDAVRQDMAMWYYKKLAENYITSIETGIKQGEIVDLPAPFITRSLMGFNHMLGLKWLVWNSSPHAEFPPQLAGEAVRFILLGMNSS